MPEQYKDNLSAAIHELAEDLHRHGALAKQTMREFDASCLCKAESLAPEEIRAIRKRENVSQPVFARYLNVSKPVFRLGAGRQEARRPFAPAACPCPG